LHHRCKNASQATAQTPAPLTRKIGLSASRLGKCRARTASPGSFLAPVTPRCSSPGLRSGSCLWLLRIHPLPLVCPPPAGGRPLYLIILPPLRYGRTTKADPAGSGPAASKLGLPPCHTAGHMAVVAGAPPSSGRSFLPSAPLPQRRRP
jgi:hypothetical protein